MKPINANRVLATAAASVVPRLEGRWLSWSASARRVVAHRWVDSSEAPAVLPVPCPAATPRPGWEWLPASVQAEIDGWSHQRVVAASPACGGLSAVFAATVTHADGSSSFVKAAPCTSPAAAAYLREAQIARLLPLGVPSARLRWHSEHDGWVIVGFDAVDGRMPEPGWVPRDGQRLVAAWQQTAAALTGASPALRSAAGRPQPLPSGWADIVAGRRRLPAHAAHLATFAPSMQDLEAGFLATCDQATTLAHFDLRPDNLLLGPDRVWLVDWATLQPGPAWIDLVTLAVAASDDGHDPQTFLDTAIPDLDGARLDQALAWMAGAWLTYAAGAPRPDAPHLRAFQLRNGLLTWRWLASRRDLPGTPTLARRGGHNLRGKA
ncbi:aminoglycoside phosphotransferase (APT) family kinase protein [Hamadaea flava]|uniref:Phosphotransferase family protein n=1 Tax=Hamadaea flava TaxID=1742688 RepID=A0ABV8LK51_9ACTN|nr:aminoglycoside phosphotransferase family protein [Hamadaea flava]MCP2323575.1 aminoglycoside phosphotransferase (APT) family kinase protein [Hamadaea flava]